MILRKAGEIFVEVKIGEAVVWNSGDLIQTAVGGEIVLPLVAVQRQLLLVKVHGHAEDAVFPPNGRGLHSDRDVMALLVAQENTAVAGPAFLDGANEGARCGAGITSFRVAMGQNVVLAAMAEDFLAHVAGYVLCPLVPEQQLHIPAQQAHSRSQALQDGMQYLWVLQLSHLRQPFCGVLSAKTEEP